MKLPEREADQNPYPEPERAEMYTFGFSHSRSWEETYDRLYRELPERRRFGSTFSDRYRGRYTA